MRALAAYQEVKQHITSALVSGKYNIAKPLPAEKYLANELRVSIGTLRKAVDELVAEGIVVRKQGKGTYVAEHDAKRSLYYFFHVVEHDSDHKDYPRVELVSFATATANREEAMKLDLKLGAPVIRICNRLFVDDACVMIDQITLSKSRFPKLTKTSFANREGTIYKLYQAHYGQSVVRTSERLRAGIVSKEKADWLGLKVGAAVLVIRRVALGIQNEPIELRVSTLNTTKHEYFSELLI